MRVELILKRMSSSHRLMVFLVAAVSFFAKNFTDFLIVDICIDGYMLIALTDAIVTLSLFIFSSSSVSFWSDSWTMELCQ